MDGLICAVCKMREEEDRLKREREAQMQAEQEAHELALGRSRRARACG
jgi:hypothetical protein